MDLFLVEQDVTRLYGEFLTDAVVVAATQKGVKKAVVKMAKDWGLEVRTNRLSVTRLGRLEVELPNAKVRYEADGCRFLAIGTGEDQDSFNLD